MNHLMVPCDYMRLFFFCVGLATYLKIQICQTITKNQIKQSCDYHALFLRMLHFKHLL
jgi:hypothetical protein